MIFVRGIYFCDIEKRLFESDSVFYDRVNFILSNKPDSEIRLAKLIKYSYLYSNVKYLKCEYSKKIMRKIKNMSHDMYVI